MSAQLSRVMLNKHRRCATRNTEEAPISGTLIALVIVLVLAAAVALDMPRILALVLA